MPDRRACSRVVFGDPPESPYLLPYPVGERYRVNQSYCYTGGGHRGQLADDFVMPIGAEVLAARAGTVVEHARRFSRRRAGAMANTTT